MSNYNSIAEFNTALANAKMQLPAMMMPFVKTASNNLANAIKVRVSSTGENNTGGNFTAYSTKYKKEKLKRGNSPYGKIVDKKNFYLTGKMWDSFQVDNIQLAGNSIQARIDFIGNNVFKSNRELNWTHSEKEFGDEKSGGIAYPNKEEEEAIVAEIEKILFETLNKIL